jgi:hypothetical protein
MQPWLIDGTFCPGEVCIRGMAALVVMGVLRTIDPSLISAVGYSVRRLFHFRDLHFCLLFVVS